jgi:hypothetical protein
MKHKNPRPFITLIEAQKFVPNAMQVRRVGEGRSRHTQFLTSCPVNSPACTANKPRWVSYNTALISGGRCMSCARFKGGITHQGYRRIYVGGKRVLEHRYVMDQFLQNTAGRKLRKNETIHHGPGGRADNSLENLSIRAPGKHPKGWSIKEMVRYVESVPPKLGGLFGVTKNGILIR